MDQILVDCGPDPDVAPGDEVVLIGTQGNETVTAWDWARRLGTIAYEVVCGIGPRVPRVLVDGASGGTGAAGALGAVGSAAAATGSEESRHAGAAAGRLTRRGDDGEERR
jgi:hypothetical protein